MGGSLGAPVISKPEPKYTMSIHDQMAEEEQRLCDAVNSGEITQAEFDREMRGLREDARAHAERCADDAYNEAMGGF